MQHFWERVSAVYKPQDFVVYLATKRSTHPTLRAEGLTPEPHGEGYSYVVRKYWRVVRLLSDGGVVCLTRRGKLRTILPQDPALRRATFWERVFLAARFPAFSEPALELPGPAVARAG